MKKVDQPSLFNDAEGMPLFSGTPIPAKPELAAETRTQPASDNLPLITGEPEKVPWDSSLPVTCRIDLRTGKKPK